MSVLISVSDSTFFVFLEKCAGTLALDWCFLACNRSHGRERLTVGTLHFCRSVFLRFTESFLWVLSVCLYLFFQCSAPQNHSRSSNDVEGGCCAVSLCNRDRGRLYESGAESDEWDFMSQFLCHEVHCRKVHLPRSMSRYSWELWGSHWCILPST